MLGKLGDIAAEVTHGAVVRRRAAAVRRSLASRPRVDSRSLATQIVQFAGVCARFDDCDEWHVTHAVLSNSLDVVDMDARHAHNCEVEAVVRLNGLSHIGWLRQVSNDCPLSALDIDTQGVRVQGLEWPDERSRPSATGAGQRALCTDQVARSTHRYSAHPPLP